MPKLMRVFINIKKSELPFALHMFSYFFLVITTFWILKTLKKGLFFLYYKESGNAAFLGLTLTAAQMELLAKIVNVAVSLAAVVVFSWLSHRWRREKLAYLFTGFFFACFVLLYFLLRNPGGEPAAWGFYVFGDLFSTVMVAVFFAFLNDTVSPHSAKRLYGPIVLGGIAGGAFGASIVNLGTGSGSLPAWMLVCAAIQVILVLHARGAAAHAAAVAEEPVPTEAAHPERIKLHSAALVGARTVLKSPYVLSIMLIVGLYESVSALMDFQFSSTIEHFSSAGDIQGRFARVFAGANWLSFVIQIFLTSFILTRHGVTTALLTLPTAIFAGSLGFLVFPKVLTASLLSAIDNGFSYSINQSAKETLYIPTDHAVKYSAKAFIDMFIQRFAKVVAILFTLGVSAYFGGFETVRWMSLVVLGVVVVWIWRARHAGEEFSRLVESVDGAGVPRSTTPQ